MCTVLWDTTREDAVTCIGGQCRRFCCVGPSPAATSNSIGKGIRRQGSVRTQCLHQLSYGERNSRERCFWPGPDALNEPQHYCFRCSREHADKASSLDQE